MNIDPMIPRGVRDNGILEISTTEQFDLEEPGILQRWNSGQMTFMATGMTMLQIYDATDTLLATEMLVMPEDADRQAYRVGYIPV